MRALRRSEKEACDITLACASVNMEGSSFSSHVRFFYKIGKGGKSAVECVSYIISYKYFLHLNRGFFCKNQIFSNLKKL